MSGESMLEAIRASDNLPSLPAVAVRVLEITRDESASMDDLAAIVQNDPAITARILKVVNSPLFGVARKVTSIRQAMNLLGRRAVQVMALSFSLVDVMRREEDSDFDYEGYWRTSLTSAVAGRLLARAARAKHGEDAFVAGLLSNVGQLAAVRCAPEAYKPVLAERTASPDRALHDIERDFLGLTHAAMGRELLARWRLPEPLTQAVGAHHGDGLAWLPGEVGELARVVHAAALLAGLFCGETPRSELEAVKARCRELTGVDAATLDTTLAAVDENVRRAAALMAIPIGETEDYSKIQLEAMQRLAQLSVDAEVERAAATRRAADARDEQRRLVARSAAQSSASHKQASIDALTCLPNRAAFDARLAEEVARATAEGHAIALAILDVDHLKRVNDAQGQVAGDEALRAVGSAIAGVCGSAGFAARYGGEEFAIVFARLAADEVAALADTVRERVERSATRTGPGRAGLTVSVGVACFERAPGELTAEALVAQADRLLYLAKKTGRNKVVMSREEGEPPEAEPAPADAQGAAAKADSGS